MSQVKHHHVVYKSQVLFRDNEIQIKANTGRMARETGKQEHVSIPA